MSLMKSKKFVTYTKKNFTDENDKNEFNTDENDKNEFKPHHKVRDHCHYTGKFRGAADIICNLIYKTPKKIPVVFIMVLHTITTS